MSTFLNDLRLEEIGSGERSGTWGTATNTNLSLIAEAFSYGTETMGDANTTITMSDAVSDEVRSLYLKITSSADLTTTRVVTLAPNAVSKVWIIENATSGSQIITIKQGSGATVNIPNGSVKVIATDGGGTSGAVFDLFTDLDVAGTFAVAGNTTVGGTLTSTGAVTANAGVSIDNITIDGTEIDLSSGDLTLDVAGDIVLDAGGGDVLLKDDTATFGSLTNTSGNLIIKSGTTTAATFSGANVTLAGTVVTGGLTTLGGNLVIPNAGNIGSVGDTDAIAISSGGVVTMNQIPVFSAGINVSGGTITGTLATAAQTAITSVGALGGGSITSGFGTIDNGSSNITTTGTISFGSLTDGTTTISSVDQDISSVSSSHDTLATALAIKTYVDNQTVTATGVVGTGTENTAIGTNALDSVQSDANRNTAFGFNAGTGITTGDDNTAFGFEAAKNVDNDQGNTAIGAYSFGGVTSTATSTGSHSSGGPGTAVGYKALGNITSAEFCTAIGYESLLSVTGGSSNVAIGYKAGRDVIGGNSNVYVGTKCAENCTGTGNTAVGHQAFLFRSGDFDHSVAMGYTTGYRAVGDNITLLGAYAGYGNSSVTCDHTGTTAVGYKSLELLQSGNDNTSVGFEAGQQMTTGAGNVALGYEAMNKFTTGSYNIGIGYQGLFGNTSGTISGGNNIGIGQTAAKDITTGDDNICIGRSAGENTTSGRDNVFIGALAGSNNGIYYQNVAIGHQAFSGTNTAFDCVSVGYSAGSSITSGSNLTCLGKNAEPSSGSATNEITLGDANVTALRCNDTSIASLSDSRDKTNIIDSPFGLDFIDSIRPVQFKWNRRNLIEGDLTASKNGKTRLGFIAQDFQKAMPNNENDILDLVYENNSNRLEAKYGNLIPILTKAIQELSAKNDALEARIKKLEG
tara:strand:+ start:107 stop:2848 length:2742 start_codon:yes stop_codon:yes gene_type:complete